MSRICLYGCIGNGAELGRDRRHMCVPSGSDWTDQSTNALTANEYQYHVPGSRLLFGLSCYNGVDRSVEYELLSLCRKRHRSFFMIDPGVSALELVFNKVCVLVTAAFVLTLVPGFRRTGRSLLSVRDRGTALLLFLVLGLIEEATVRQAGLINHRIIAVCAAGLLAGPSVGVIVSMFVTWLAVAYDGRPPAPIAISMLSGALVGGWLHRWRPTLAQRPLTGFCLTSVVTSLRDGLVLFYAPGAAAMLKTLGQMWPTALLQGLGTALILAIVEQVREREEQARATASAEVRALQARMNPHFLFNALNALAALATVAPREIPRAAGRLREFLRATFDQPERVYVSLEEELAVVRAYLDIESLRFRSRLKVEQAIDPGLADTLIPPFSLQPLVENAVQHGVQSSAKAGRLRLVVCRTGGSGWT
jgi:two-component system LytT family sensor kinase